MPQWLKEFVLAAFAMLREPLTTVAAYLAGLRQGRTKQKVEQLEHDIEAAKKARVARRSVDPDGVRDPANRDN